MAAQRAEAVCGVSHSEGVCVGTNTHLRAGIDSSICAVGAWISEYNACESSRMLLHCTVLCHNLIR